MSGVEEMDVEVNHYAVLGLPSGEEGARLSQQEIDEAYRSKASALHLDERPDDPDAHAAFVRLQTSYEVLKDERQRMLFDDLLREKRRLRLRMMMSDLKNRQRFCYRF